MISDEARKEGFELFRNGQVRRLSSAHFAVRNQDVYAWQIVELRDGKWVCDCESADGSCAHLYAAQLSRSTLRLQPEPIDEEHLKCRHCGSLDIARCGFRYNAHGIARRYKCNDCERKFSIPHIQSGPNSKPDEIVWLLNEVGMLTSKLTELLSDLNARLELVGGLNEYHGTEPKSQSLG